MGQKLYFDNYTAAGDILVIAICFVISILVATSYNTRRGESTSPLLQYVYCF